MFTSDCEYVNLNWRSLGIMFLTIAQILYVRIAQNYMSQHSWDRCVPTFGTNCPNSGTPRLETLQPSDVQLSESVASLGTIGVQLRAPRCRTLFYRGV